MPWRLIQFIIIFAIFLLFIVFNLENRCDVSFGFRQIKEVPVFLTAFASFFLGILCAMPFVLTIQAKRKAKAAAPAGNSGAKPSQGPSPKSAKKPAWKRDAPKGGKPGEGGGLSDGGPYGID